MFDDSEPIFDDRASHKCDCSEFYPEAEELIPPDMPEPLGKPVKMTCFAQKKISTVQEVRFRVFQKIATTRVI